MDTVVERQNRPLDAVYPIVYLDCTVLKIRQVKRVINKAIYLVLGINIVNVNPTTEQEASRELIALLINGMNNTLKSVSRGVVTA